MIAMLVVMVRSNTMTSMPIIMILGNDVEDATMIGDDC